MAGLDLHKVQERREIIQDGQKIKTIRNLKEPQGLVADAGPRIWLWDGKVYDESGNELDPEQYPGWFWHEIKKLSPKTLHKTGWTAKVRAYKG